MSQKLTGIWLIHFLAPQFYLFQRGSNISRGGLPPHQFLCFWGRPFRSSLPPPRFRLSLDCCFLTICPLGSFPCSYRGYTLHLIATYTLLSLSGSLPFRSAPDWQHSFHSYRAPCHLGQPPTGTSHPPILSGSLPFRSAPDWTSTANAHYLGPTIFNSIFYTLFCVVALYTISFGNCGLSAI